MDLYFTRMRRDRQYGDMPTLMAAAELYGFTVFHYEIRDGGGVHLNREFAPEGPGQALDPTHLHVLFQTDGRNGGHYDTIIPPAGPAFADVANAAHARLDAMDAEIEGQHDAPVMAGAGSPPATCVHCKNPVSSHGGKTCRSLGFQYSGGSIIPGLDTDSEVDTVPAAAEAPAAASTTEPLDTEPAVAAVPAAAPAVAELPVAPVPAVAVPPLSDDEAMVHNFPYPLPAGEPVAHPQPAPLNINLNPGNEQLDFDSPINNNPNPSFSFLPFSS